MPTPKAGRPSWCFFSRYQGTLGVVADTCNLNPLKKEDRKYNTINTKKNTISVLALETPVSSSVKHLFLTADWRAVSSALEEHRGWSGPEGKCYWQASNSLSPTSVTYINCPYVECTLRWSHTRIQCLTIQPWEGAFPLFTSFSFICKRKFPNPPL